MYIILRFSYSFLTITLVIIKNFLQIDVGRGVLTAPCFPVWNAALGVPLYTKRRDAG